MTQVLAELDAVKRSAINSLDMTALQFRGLAKTVPNELGQNIMAIIQQTDIVGAVRQRTGAQMDVIATQVDRMTDRGSGFVKNIKNAEDNLKLRYDRLQRSFWGIVGGAMLATVIVTGFSSKFFFSEGVDRNYNAIVSTYRLVEQLKVQCYAPTGKLDPVLNNLEMLKKK
ncbi:hypothetical protein L7750_02615 [Xenorhabdus bovienii]|uniref:hypothetical protein n=1 Tax=Xenorhabdus bovienii TaxID=40576 RepID=UPI001EDE19AB|nr:hypothetical protein [Xenorhabdus bovienii]MCG3469327.1 hypothetical protein [Xenorhabdus bovienii]